MAAVILSRQGVRISLSDAQLLWTGPDTFAIHDEEGELIFNGHVDQITSAGAGVLLINEVPEDTV